MQPVHVMHYYLDKKNKMEGNALGLPVIPYLHILFLRRIHRSRRMPDQDDSMPSRYVDHGPRPVKVHS